MSLKIDIADKIKFIKKFNIINKLLLNYNMIVKLKILYYEICSKDKKKR